MVERRLGQIPVVLDDQATFSIRQVCRVCGVHAERIVEVVEHGLVEVPGASPLEWRFSASAVFRIRRAINLCDDLGMNLPGASLAVELLEELDQLQAEVARLSRIAHQ